MTKKMLVGMFAAVALVACGGGTQASSSDGTTASQGTDAPHIECGSGSGHHGGGCDDSGGETPTDGATTPADGTVPTDGSSTTTTTTTTTTTP